MDTPDLAPAGEHAAEAKERWGNTDAFKESARRTKSYSPKTWAAIKAENEEIEADFAKAMNAGLKPNSPEAVALAERARHHIDRWFYPCTAAMHAGVAEMYTSDPRFRANYDNRAEGLAEFVASAIRANAGKGESG